MLRPLDRFVYNKYNKIIGITDQVTDNLQNWIGQNVKLVTIENGVNLDQIRSAQQLSNESNYSSFKNDRFKILMVGRFDGKHKDQLTLIRSLKYLPNNVHIYFAGDGPALERIKKEAFDLGFESNIDFLGLRNDVYALMKMVDLNVLSTNTEGLSGVTLESLASCKPFIGSDVEGVHNIVPDKSFLFPKQNPEKLAAKISEIMQNSTVREELVIKAKKFIGKYDILNMVENYLFAYESCIE
jgi:glycosyltransferase involved in cell wall biosynthesis